MGPAGRVLTCLFGRKGQKRRAEEIATALQVAQIATVETEETYLAKAPKERDSAFRRHVASLTDTRRRDEGLRDSEIRKVSKPLE